MSSLTRCNYCSLLLIKKEAKNINCRVLKRASDGMGLGGIDVYVVPKGEKLTKKNENRYFRAWFMAIGDRCECRSFYGLKWICYFKESKRRK